MKKTREEIVGIRVDILKDMNKYVLEKISDEELIYYWLEEGIPDCPSDDDFLFIAEDDEEWERICSVFNFIVKQIHITITF